MGSSTILVDEFDRQQDKFEQCDHTLYIENLNFKKTNTPITVKKQPLSSSSFVRILNFHFPPLNTPQMCSGVSRFGNREQRTN